MFFYFSFGDILNIFEGRVLLRGFKEGFFFAFFGRDEFFGVFGGGRSIVLEICETIDI